MPTPPQNPVALAKMEKPGRRLDEPLSRQPDLSGLGNVPAHRNRLDSDITRQTDPDYLAVSFPGQFQSPMVVIAVWVFPIERHRPTGNFDVVNGELLERVGSVTTSTVPVVSVFTL
jgi:hypothetical protein